MLLRCISMAIIIFSMISSLFSLGGLYMATQEIHSNYVSPKVTDQYKISDLFPAKTKCWYEWDITNLYFFITAFSYLCTFIGIYLYKEASKRYN